MGKLAILGGKKAVTGDVKNLFTWPIVNKAMENAVVRVLRERSMSGDSVTKEFERKFADWHGVRYGLGFNNGTASLHGAFFGLGLGVGDEIIAPAITYWATALPALSLGCRIVFADIDPETLCIDPKDIERRITPRTKAIVVVHYMAMPADMDAIIAVARKHNLKVVEDVSHAHGAMYKGRMVGSIGDAAGFSLMTSKSFAIGEGGIMLTNDRKVYERALMLGFYERHGDVEDAGLMVGAGIPWGGHKYRMHQMSAAVGLEQLKKYPGEMEEIDRAMNYFWDLLEGLPGIRANRPRKGSGTTKGGWYAARGLYVPEELGGLSVTRFCEAVSAEGCAITPGCNKELHTHPLFSSIDVYKHGRPTNTAYIKGNPPQPRLPVAEGIHARTFSVPWFVRFRKKLVQEHAEAFIKVIENHRELIAGDKENSAMGTWALSHRN